MKKSKKSIYIDYFDLFWSILIIIDLFSDFLIKSGNNIINFFVIIWIRTTRADQESRLKGDSNLISNKF